MTRTVGAKNIRSFDTLTKIETSSSSDIKHLSDATNKTALEQFKTVLKNQQNYIKWIESRHTELMALKKASGNKGPKDATYNKYRWYAEQNCLLEAINAFEVFYKRSAINLAKSLRLYTPPDRMKGAVDNKILWSVTGKFSIPELIFEHQLYHDLDNIDQATDALIQEKRYNKSNKKTNKLAKTNTCIGAIFQIRHTISHNYGLVTRSDCAKFKFASFESTSGEVIDPTKNSFGLSVNRFLEVEAEAFTEWLLINTAKYLKELNASIGTPLQKSALSRVETGLGKHASISALPWV